MTFNISIGIKDDAGARQKIGAVGRELDDVEKKAGKARDAMGRFTAGTRDGMGQAATGVSTFKKQIEANARRLKAGGKDDRLDKEDILAGLTSIVTVRLAEPQFEGQTKEVLGTSAVRGIVARVVESELTRLLTSTKRGEKQQAALLL